MSADKNISQPHPTHLAIVTTALAVMFTAAVVGLIFAFTGNLNVRAGAFLGAVTVAGILTMAGADRWYRRHW